MPDSDHQPDPQVLRAKMGHAAELRRQAAPLIAGASALEAEVTEAILAAPRRAGVKAGPPPPEESVWAIADEDGRFVPLGGGEFPPEMKEWLASFADRFLEHPRFMEAVNEMAMAGMPMDRVTAEHVVDALRRFDAQRTDEPEVDQEADVEVVDPE